MVLHTEANALPWVWARVALQGQSVMVTSSLRFEEAKRIEIEKKMVYKDI